MSVAVPPSCVVRQSAALIEAIDLSTARDPRALADAVRAALAAGTAPCPVATCTAHHAAPTR